MESLLPESKDLSAVAEGRRNISFSGVVSRTL